MGLRPKPGRGAAALRPLRRPRAPGCPLDPDGRKRARPQECAADCDSKAT